MSRDVHAVFEAIDRWAEGMLIDEVTAAKLREDVTRHASSGTRRLSQYLLATSGGAVLLIAAGIFVDWAWPLIDVGGQAALLAAAGVLVLILGARLEGGRRWLPASYLMQTAGLGLLLGAFAYSEEVWLDRTPGGVVIGVLALATPIVLAPRAMRRNVVMPAVHLAMGFGFLAVFLDRTTSLSGNSTVWILDGVLLASVFVLIAVMLRDPDGERHPWALNAFVMAMFGGFFLIAWTGLGVLRLSNEVLYPLDLWLALTVALTLWGIHAAPDGLRREWFGQLLALLMLTWIPFGLLTAYETIDGPAELALLLVAGVGGAGFVYGNREEIRALMAASTLAFVTALWVWAVDRGGALGAVAALVVTAALLFWISGRTGEPDGAQS
jgi:hypothetical protein